jgi:hypothetical protein
VLPLHHRANTVCGRTYGFHSQSQAADMSQEYRLILKNADKPGYTPDLECYFRHGGYETLRKALSTPPKDLPDGKKLSAGEQIREDV